MLGKILKFFLTLGFMTEFSYLLAKYFIKLTLYFIFIHIYMYVFVIYIYTYIYMFLHIRICRNSLVSHAIQWCRKNCFAFPLNLN